jgi:predicted CXXCH cytochrome family protein
MWLISILLDTALAQDDVSNSVHNLTTSGPGTIRLSAPPASPGREEICVFCHTPHHGDVTVTAPLWNRAINTSAYTMYSSPTIDMVVAAQPQGVSMACLSCHDGTIAFDQVRNGPGPGDLNTAAPSRGWSFLGGRNNMTHSVYANVAADLLNDHPVSVTYNTANDPMFNPIASAEAAGLRFFGTGTQVECATCHNPHDPTNRPFLRIDNTNSTLCLTCHIK